MQSFYALVKKIASKRLFGLALVMMVVPVLSAEQTPTQAERIHLQLKGLHPFQFAGYYAEQELKPAHEWSTTSPIIQERNTISKCWLGLKVKQNTQIETIIKYASIILALLLFFSYWIYRLQRSEKALRASEMKLKAILDTEPECVKIVDAQGKLLQMNQAGLRMVDALENPSQVIGQQVNQLITEAYRDAFNTMHKRVIQGETRTLEFQIDSLKGTRRWMETHSVPFKDCFSEQVSALSVTRDISDRKRIEQREQSRNQVLELLTKNAKLSKILEAIVQNVEKDNPSMLCSILLLDENNCLSIGAAPNLPDFYNNAIQGLKIGPDIGSCGAACYSGQQFIVADIQNHPNWAAYKELAAQAKLLSCWSEPIRSSNNKILGAFAIYHTKVCSPTAEDTVLIAYAANLAGIAIARYQTEEALQIANMVYQHSSEAMLVTDSENRIIAINPAFTEITGYSLEEVTGNIPELLQSQAEDGEFYNLMWQALENTGQWQGEMWDTRKNDDEFAKWMTINTIFDKGKHISHRVILFSDITEKKNNETIIWNQANYDALTGLPNRRMFCDRLTHELLKAKRSHQPVALLFLDLDHFKEINDTLGHNMGDILLIEAAMRIGGCVRESDTVSRLGGDEFTIILPGQTDMLFIERIAQKIIASLKKPFKLGHEFGYLSASIGIAMYPNDALTMAELLKNADLAMYLAKQLGRGRFSYFTKEMQLKAHKRRALITDLRHALEADQFQLYFQPVIDLSTGKIIKAEALIRWHHPIQGLISPVEFIPLAEESGLIATIGNWVFKAATRQTKQWLNLYNVDFQISINKSPAQFKSKHDHTEWIKYIEQIGLPGKNIVIEITEGLLMDSEPEIVKVLQLFHDAGIQVAVDDFGTGYSSFAYLKKFDVDYLKIDQSFIRNLAPDSDDMALSEAIIVMAHKLGLKVIAEGVETEQQHRLLTEAECDYAQGYLFSQPLPSKEFEALLASQVR